MSVNRIKKHFKVSFGFRSSRSTQKKSRASSSGHHPGRISDATGSDNETVLLSSIKLHDFELVITRAPRDVRLGGPSSRRPGSLSLSFPSLKSLRASSFSFIVFVLGEQTSGIETRSLRTGTRKFKIQDGTNVDVLRRPGYN